MGKVVPVLEVAALARVQTQLKLREERLWQMRPKLKQRTLSYALA
jgi:hypothetical protein